ncbi:MAG TPA: hypothetical protein VME86_14095 [Acidobacteriaceae bacterium]|nr:hypothetical protein [Acidobacteriaceae bacterium]
MPNQDPQTDAARLAAHYAQLSERELQKIGSQYGSLTEAAQSALRAEFDRRGLPAPELSDSEILDYQPLVTLRQYRDPADALLAKSALDSAGIFAFLQNENIVRMDWVWSNLMGGIRLQVRPEDVAAAEELLSEPIPSVIETDDTSYEQPRCPHCQSLDIRFERLNQKVGLASIILAVPIPWPRKLWSCASCGAKWEDRPNTSATP